MADATDDQTSRTDAIPADRITTLSATRATTDDALVRSWLEGMASPHSRRGCAMVAERFLAALGRQGLTLRTATVEDVRDALNDITAGASASSARQYVLRCKSLMSYGHKLGYLPFNAGVTVKVRSSKGDDEANAATRQLSEVDIRLLIRACSNRRDRVMIETAYAGGLRISELVGLTWGDVIARDNGRLQLNVRGKGGKRRQVLMPAVMSEALQALRAECGDQSNDAPIFQATRGGRAGRHPLSLSERAVNALLKRIAKAAGVTGNASPHWLRHAHASHALDRGAALSTVQATLGHGNVATTSTYLHARPGVSSGWFLDESIFRA